MDTLNLQLIQVYFFTESGVILSVLLNDPDTFLQLKLNKNEMNSVHLRIKITAGTK